MDDDMREWAVKKLDEWMTLHEDRYPRQIRAQELAAITASEWFQGLVEELDRLNQQHEQAKPKDLAYYLSRPPLWKLKPIPPGIN